MSSRNLWSGSTGFTLLPVVLAMSLIAAIAFLLNRDNGVNANLIGAQSDRERARYAAEAGLQAANYAIQGLDCAGFPSKISPVIDTDFGGARYSAYADNTTVLPPPLTLTSTGSYNGASVTLTKSPVIAFHSAIQKWTTQPDFVLGTSTENWVTSFPPGQAKKNQVGSALIAMDGSSGTELLIKFDLPSFPVRTKIVPSYPAGQLQPGANLMLYRINPTVSAAESIYVMLITRNWMKDLATWITYDGANNWPLPGVGYDPRPVSTNKYLTTVSNLQSLDLTNAAIAWTNDYPNNGVWIRGGPLVNNAQFALSSDITSLASDTSSLNHRPKLVVSYLLPCGATAPPPA